MMRIRYALVMMLAAVVGMSSLVGAADISIEEHVKGLVDNMPGAKPADVFANAAALVKVGPVGVETVCRMLVAPGKGDNAKAEYALDALAIYVYRPGAEAERQMFVKAVAGQIGGAPGKEVKAFLIKRLEVTGKSESVGAIAKYLSDERLCEPACQALTAIATDNARASLAEALAGAKGNNVVTIISALGNTRCKAAAKDLLKYAKSKDANVRRAALEAIANIADASAAKVLAKACKAKGSYERSIATSSYLLYARRVAEEGDTKRSAAICRDLIKTGAGHVKCGALSVLVGVIGEAALGDLLAAVDSDDMAVRAAAVGLADEIGGQAATNRWIEKMNASEGAIKAEIMYMFGGRGDEGALYQIIGAFDDSDKDVRIAAIATAVKLGGDKAVMSVMEFVKKSTVTEEIDFAVQTVNRVKGDTVQRAMAKSLPTMNSAGKVAIIKALAARKATIASDAVFAETKSSDGKVRSAAIKALVDVAGAADTDKLIAILGGATGGSDRTNAQRAIVAATGKIADPAKRAAKVVKAMKAAEGEKKIALIQVLGKIGGKSALGAVVAEIANAEAGVADAAVRAVTGWPYAEAVGQLAKIVETTDNTTHRVLAIRGVVRLINTGEVVSEKATATYAGILRSVERAEDRKMVIAGLANVRTVESLRLVSNYLTDESLKSEAAIAAVKIACPQGRGDRGLRRYEAVVILRRALASIADAKLKEQAEKHIKSIAASKVAEIKPVPEGFVALFNGKDLTGWKALLHSPNDNPIKRAQLSPEKHAELQAKEDESMRKSWTVKDGVLYFDGKGFSLATAKKYKDFEMLVDWKVVEPRGDSGIYLRGAPQVQIWDPGQHKVGSGGLYNNKKNPSKPSKIADNPIGTWNTFRIIMIGEKVTVYLNGELVVDNVTMENYWDRSSAIFDSEQIELQCHGNPIEFTNIFIRELPRPGEFRSLFNGRDLAGWIGDTKGYIVEDGVIACKPGGNLYTEEQFDDFHLKFDFKLTRNANNGLGIRTPIGKDAAYAGMELQILDDSGSAYTKLAPYQYHGSIYGIVASRTGFQKPVGEWNHQEVIAKGPKIRVILNDEDIVDADLEEAVKNYVPGKMHDPKRHPGLMNKGGYIGFLGHGSVVYFKNIEIMELD